MGALLGIWNGLKDGLEWVLRFYAELMDPFLGAAAWGVAIILLTATVRLFMIPLMVRQVRSMRAMQELQPQLKKIQEKYKVDRSMMKTDPERYRKIKEKQREAQMALYQEHQVNPVGGCLPLLLQMPIFLALFQVLQEPGRLPQLENAPFFGITSLTDTAQGIITNTEGLVIWAAVSAMALVVLQVVTTYYSTKQMMARNKQAAAEQQQAQKIMLYLMPPFLGFLSFTFPLGVVLYWATTNVWTIGQQALIFRQVEAEEARKAEAREAEKTNRGKKAQIDKVTDAGDGSEDIVDDTPEPSGNGQRNKGAQSKGRQSKGGQSKGGQNQPAGKKAAGNKGKGGNPPGSQNRRRGGEGKPDQSAGGERPGQRKTGRSTPDAKAPSGSAKGGPPANGSNESQPGDAKPALKRGQKRQPGSRSGPGR